MSEVLRDLRERLRRALGGLSAPVMAVIAIVAGGGVVAGSIFAYRTYDYVQHDNEFCLTCHLMRDPYERFGQSAHRGLGCKACHQPTLVTRSQMALTQIIENPEELEAHAYVPNRACADCHVEGDPEKWTLIAASAGHRVHLESADSALQGLNCVECHASSVHEFAATDQTCGQAGCHTDTRIQLGRMGDFTIHCVSCHNFSTPVPDTAGLRTAMAALRPEQGECLTCHAMRALVEVPEDDPHEGACGACHDPHTQTTPAEAGEGCTSGQCHQDPVAESPMHRGLSQSRVASCTQCHQAHDFSLEAEDCLACHQDIYEDEGRPAGGAVARGPAPPLDVVTPVGLSQSRGTPGPAPGQEGQTPPFLHDQHRAMECTSCHSTEGSHGRVTVSSLRDCRSCHHTAPVANDCRSCHPAGDFSGESKRLSRTVSFSVAPPRPRALPFDHRSHESLDCGQCHGSPPALDASDTDCGACHEAHHEVGTVSCLTCHEPAPEGEHTLQVHLGCTGSGCHETTPFAGLPRARNLCLVCHQEQVDHRVGQNCVECHPLPAPDPARVRPGGP